MIDDKQKGVEKMEGFNCGGIQVMKNNHEASNGVRLMGFGLRLR